MARPSAAEFERFAASLTQEERVAVQKWLGAHSSKLRNWQQEGVVSSEATREEVTSFETAFNAALAKALICREPLWRGLNSRIRYEGSKEYLRSLIVGLPDIMFMVHASATLSQSIGRGHCYLEPEDQRDHAHPLAVLLLITPLTARYLWPFRHDHCDEEEVVLLQGSRYRRTRAQRVANPASAVECWEVEIVELPASSS